MELDQEICLCFHVTRRKIESFIRHQNPQRAAQLAECFGAGTGCGWCRKYLIALFEAARNPENDETTAVTIPDAIQYAEMRRQFRKDGNGTQSE